MASVLLAYVFPSLGVLVASLMFLSPLKAVHQAKAEGVIGVRTSCAQPPPLPAIFDPAGSAIPKLRKTQACRATSRLEKRVVRCCTGSQPDTVPSDSSELCR